MSKKEIYRALLEGGMTRAGALGMMGNIGWESAFRPDNVEDTCPLSDADYTYNVNIGQIIKGEFISDGYGYGLCQWTYPSRKAGLWDLSKGEDVSISNERMQLEYLLHELRTDFPKLFAYLCSTNDMHEATSRVCYEFENPAVKNVEDRYKIACACANEPYDDEDQGDCSDDACPIDPNEETCEIGVRILRKGMLGRDVFILQTALNDMGCDCGVPDGDFGKNTEAGVKDLQRSCNLDVTGVVGQVEWQIIFQ